MKATDKIEHYLFLQLSINALKSGSIVKGIKYLDGIELLREL
jgi:hypothetical protein